MKKFIYYLFLLALYIQPLEAQEKAVKYNPIAKPNHFKT